MGGNIHIDLNLWGHVGTCDTWFWSVNTTCPAGDLSFGPAARICEWGSWLRVAFEYSIILDFAWGIRLLHINELHCEDHWEVRECLYVYSMSKHNDQRTCEKVGELWSLSRAWLWSLLIIPHTKNDFSRKPRLVVSKQPAWVKWLCLVEHSGKAQKWQSFSRTKPEHLPAFGVCIDQILWKPFFKLWFLHQLPGWSCQ